MIGKGAFALRPGECTDGMSMALCLASREPPAAPARQVGLFCDPDFERAGAVDDLTKPPSD